MRKPSAYEQATTSITAAIRRIFDDLYGVELPEGQYSTSDLNGHPYSSQIDYLLPCEGNLQVKLSVYTRFEEVDKKKHYSIYPIWAVFGKFPKELFSSAKKFPADILGRYINPITDWMFGLIKLTPAMVYVQYLDLKPNEKPEEEADNISILFCPYRAFPNNGTPAYVTVKLTISVN